MSGKYESWQCVLTGILAVRAENVNNPSTSEIANIGMSDFLYLRLAERERSRFHLAPVTPYTVVVGMLAPFRVRPSTSISPWLADCALGIPQSA